MLHLLIGACQVVLLCGWSGKYPSELGFEELDCESSPEDKEHLGILELLRWGSQLGSGCRYSSALAAEK